MTCWKIRRRPMLTISECYLLLAKWFVGKGENIQQHPHCLIVLWCNILNDFLVNRKMIHPCYPSYMMQLIEWFVRKWEKIHHTNLDIIPLMKWLVEKWEKKTLMLIVLWCNLSNDMLVNEKKNPYYACDLMNSWLVEN